MKQQRTRRHPLNRLLWVCTLTGAMGLGNRVAHAEDAVPPRLKEGEHFMVDPVADGVLIGSGVAFAKLLDLVLGTGEIVPNAPASPNNLLGIDRVAVTQRIDPHADRYSTIGLWAAYGYALIDPIVSGVRGGRQALLVDAVMYAESISLTWAFTDMTKIAVRRPRPTDYSVCAASSVGECANNTNLQLSFFSGHASSTAAVGATATYLAFVRQPHSVRPWLTLGAATALTTFVSYERVRAGSHFPTDVIMGSLAGAAIGVLVPHFHRRPHYHGNDLEAAPTWIGFAPISHGQGAISAGWVF